MLLCKNIFYFVFDYFGKGRTMVLTKFLEKGKVTYVSAYSGLNNKRFVWYTTQIHKNTQYAFE